MTSEALVSAKSPPSRAATAGERWRLVRYGSGAALLCVIAAGILYFENNREPLLRQAFGVPTGENRLAVLPVTLVDSDPDEGYLADGMTQELIAQLSRIGGLRVIARSSVMGYSGGSKNATEMGRELSVRHGSTWQRAQSRRPATDLDAPR